MSRYEFNMLTCNIIMSHVEKKIDCILKHAYQLSGNLTQFILREGNSNNNWQDC